MNIKIPFDEAVMTSPKTEFIITGTHAYGPVTPESDLDICVPEDCYSDLYDWCFERSSLECWQTELQHKKDYGGFYFKIFDITVNVIVASHVEGKPFTWWKEATENEVFDGMLRGSDI